MPMDRGSPHAHWITYHLTVTLITASPATETMIRNLPVLLALVLTVQFGLVYVVSQVPTVSNAFRHPVLLYAAAILSIAE